MPILLGTAANGFTFVKSQSTIGLQEYTPSLFDEDNNQLLDPNDSIWQALPSFYRDFLNNKEIIESVWMATRMLLGSDLLKLYQYSFNSSSQDATRLFQRKWQYLDFNKKLNFSNTKSRIAESIANISVVNSSGAFGEVAGDTFLDIILSNSASQRSDFVFYGNSYEAEEQSISDKTSLSWQVDFALTETNKSSSFLLGYIKTANPNVPTNAILSGVSSQTNNNLYLCHIDDTGNITELIDASFNLKEGVRYKTETEYYSQTNSLVCTLFESDATLFPYSQKVTLGSPLNFNSNGLADILVTSVTFQGTSIPVQFTKQGGEDYDGVLFSDGRLVVPDLANSTLAHSFFTIRKVGEEAIPTDVSEGLYTNKFKLPSGTIPIDISVGDTVKVYSATLVDTNGDGIVDSVISKQSKIKALDSVTGEITVEAKILSINQVPISTEFPDGVIPELVYIVGYTDKLLDLDGDNINESKVTLTLDIVGTATDYKFTSDSFGLVGFNGSSNYPIQAGNLRIFDWEYAWPVLADPIAFLPSIRPNILNTSGHLSLGTDYNTFEKQIRFINPNRGKYYAEYIAFDEATLYENFGYLLGLDKESSSVNYRSKVRALLFSLYKGPTIQSVKGGFALYLGLPISEEAGEITTLNDSYSTASGQIVITNSIGEQKTYYYPKRSGTSLSVGDTVSQFQVLGDGTNYYDYISNATEIGKTSIEEIKKYHTILFDFDLAKIDANKVPDASNFIDRIKPTFKNKIIRGSLEVLEEQEIETEFVINVTANLYDPFCSFPQPRYDNNFYIDPFDQDYMYDQFIDDWQPSGGISSINSGQDGVPSATLIASRDYTHEILSTVYGNNTLREFITGVVQATSGSTTITGTSNSAGQPTVFTTEVGPTLSGLPTGQELFLILHPYYEGTGASATQYSNLLVGSSGDFDGLVAGDIVVLSGLQIDDDGDSNTPPVDSLHDNGSFMVAESFGNGSDRIELTHAFVNRPSSSIDTYTNISWYAYKAVATAAKIDSITDDTNLEIRTAAPANYSTGNPTKYLATMANPDFIAIYYDYFEEHCPNETVGLYFGSDFSKSTELPVNSTVTPVYSPVGLSLPTTNGIGSPYARLNNNISYSHYNQFWNYNTFNITTDVTLVDEVTLVSNLTGTLKVGDWLAFPLLPGDSGRIGITAEGDNGSATDIQGATETIFAGETVTNANINGGSAHYMGFSWHRVVDISGAKPTSGNYSITNPKIQPRLNPSVGAQSSYNSGLIHITEASAGRGVAIAVGQFTSGSNTLTFEYLGTSSFNSFAPGLMNTSFDPADSNRDDEYIPTGMFMLAIVYSGEPNTHGQGWDSDWHDMIVQVTDGTHTATGNPNEYSIQVRRWSTSEHSGISATLPSAANTKHYMLIPIDATHPRLQENTNNGVFADQLLTGNGAIGAKLGMSEIFDKHTNGGTTHNSLEVSTATSGSTEDGTINSIIVEPTP